MSSPSPSELDPPGVRRARESRGGAPRRRFRPRQCLGPRPVVHREEVVGPQLVLLAAVEPERRVVRRRAEPVSLRRARRVDVAPGIDHERPAAARRARTRAGRCGRALRARSARRRRSGRSRRGRRLARRSSPRPGRRRSPSPARRVAPPGRRGGGGRAGRRRSRRAGGSARRRRRRSAARARRAACSRGRSRASARGARGTSRGANRDERVGRLGAADEELGHEPVVRGRGLVRGAVRANLVLHLGGRARRRPTVAQSRPSRPPEKSAATASRPTTSER